jgi:plasmid stabilization system protein ParE
MMVTYHPSVQRDVNGILKHYNEISGRLADEFWEELISHIGAAAKQPEHFHLTGGGFRRVNLQKFPYHFLFRTRPGNIRIIVVRHNKRDPNYAVGRK